MLPTWSQSGTGTLHHWSHSLVPCVAFPWISPQASSLSLPAAFAPRASSIKQEGQPCYSFKQILTSFTEPSADFQGRFQAIWKVLCVQLSSLSTLTFHCGSQPGLLHWPVSPTSLPATQLLLARNRLFLRSQQPKFIFFKVPSPNLSKKKKELQLKCWHLHPTKVGKHGPSQMYQNGILIIWNPWINYSQVSTQARMLQDSYESSPTQSHKLT